jgi:signal transduction histidine kinase
MSVARTAAGAHGGRIGPVSAPGEGTTAWFALPAQPSP